MSDANTSAGELTPRGACRFAAPSEPLARKTSRLSVPPRETRVGSPLVLHECSGSSRSWSAR